MSPVAIPPWTANGVLPPNNASQPTSAERSPYVVSLTDYILRFGGTPERRTVLEGFIRYRAALHTAGVVQGFQWLDGSFLENVELIEKRAPNDMDVVTFYRLPNGISQRQLAANLGSTADPDTVRAEFCVDGYLVHLGMDAERLASQSAYWYGVWSHRRDQLWKGFVQVDLAPAEDSAATTMLSSLVKEVGRP